MEATAFVTVVRERLDDDGDLTLQDMLHAGEVNRLMAQRVERRAGEALADVHDEIAALRRELREEMQKLRADIRLDGVERSADSLKWGMLLWVGQALAVAGIVSALR